VVQSPREAPTVKRRGIGQGGCGGGSLVRPGADEMAELKTGGGVPL
jgi:hypothetical protein